MVGILRRTLDSYINAKTNYSRYATIVQSSGTGKSRMVSELGRKVVSIPLNLLRNRGICTFVRTVVFYAWCLLYWGRSNVVSSAG